MTKAGSFCPLLSDALYVKGPQVVMFYFHGGILIFVGIPIAIGGTLDIIGAVITLFMHSGKAIIMLNEEVT